MSQDIVQEKIEKVYASDCLELNNVSFSPLYSLNRGTLSQLILGLNNMRLKIDENTVEKNKMQTKIYPIISIMCKKIYDMYLESCKNIDSNDLRIYSYFLMGPFGNGTLRNPTSASNERKIYKYAELGTLFKAILSRLYHAHREVENRISNEKFFSDKTSYEHLKLFLETFNIYVTQLSITWRDSINKIREEEGVYRNVPHSSFSEKSVNL